ncbi:SDR family oxidoreductase [Actinocatenispora rupis]|uniref:Short-chain dehydrogenase n=1 Tax=Actinocatenispora rupis TaxID=519421 RepID=A0A8J3JDA4_9ACTN|nr:SDR family oxidoreductase [Actinocatenispora rupis]GID16315.1 short-chain dehydrogenase [Actinocatenispora rupis]
MDLGIAGRVALVSGATSGLGRAVAVALAAEGARVAICGRDEHRLAAAAARVTDAAAAYRAGDAPERGCVRADRVDLRDHDAVRGWIDAVATDLGGPDIVVSNAGGPPAGPVTAFDLAAYRDAVELCLLAHIGFVQAALPRMRAAGWGRILLVASETVRQPRPQYGLSNTVRPGLVGYAKSLVPEIAPDGVTINVLAPGYHRTPALTGQFDDPDAGLARIAAGIPVGRIGDPDDFAATAAFLASERAGFITGSTVLVDGGATQGW